MFSLIHKVLYKNGRIYPNPTQSKFIAPLQPVNLANNRIFTNGSHS
ncbi:MAG: hypothetical protein WCK13_10295 [Ignavibacteriota bacterium]|nr:hypothetical protein [Ignavibacteriota bacterium]